MSDPINPFIAAQPLVQAASHIVNSEDVKDFVSPARQKAKEALAQVAGIVFGLVPAMLAPTERWIIGTNSQTQITRDTAQSKEAINRIFLKSVEEIMQEVANRVAEKTSEESIQPPPLYVAGPALEAMRFAQNEPDLRRLYVNLLASSMDKETVQRSHPGFIEIIKQLTPDEALILRKLRPGDSWAEIDLLAISKDDRDSFDVLAHHVSTIGEQSGCKNTDLVPAYIDNLCRLGVLAIPYGRFIDDEDVYAELKKHPTSIAQQVIANQQGRNFDIRRSYLTLTDFGGLLWEVCVSD